MALGARGGIAWGWQAGPPALHGPKGLWVRHINTWPSRGGSTGQRMGDSSASAGKPTLPGQGGGASRVGTSASRRSVGIRE